MELNLATRAHQPESMKTPKMITIDYPWLPIVYLLEPWLHFWMLGIVPFILFSSLALFSSALQFLSSSPPQLLSSSAHQLLQKTASTKTDKSG
jgi:hypothetical protein